MTSDPPDRPELDDEDLRVRLGLQRLTPAERRVLSLLAQGAAPKQAAWKLQVAITTVRSHIASAKRKTGARTLHQLVGAYAQTVSDDDSGAER